ncbi:MAG: DUF4347 domain-containing protein, partial [Pirellula sp.]
MKNVASSYNLNSQRSSASRWLKPTIEQLEIRAMLFGDPGLKDDCLAPEPALASTPDITKNDSTEPSSFADGSGLDAPPASLVPVAASESDDFFAATSARDSLFSDDLFSEADYVDELAQSDFDPAQSRASAEASSTVTDSLFASQLASPSDDSNEQLVESLAEFRAEVSLAPATSELSETTEPSGAYQGFLAPPTVQSIAQTKAFGPVLIDPISTPDLRIASPRGPPVAETTGSLEIHDLQGFNSVDQAPGPVVGPSLVAKSSDILDGSLTVHASGNIFLESFQLGLLRQMGVERLIVEGDAATDDTLYVDLSDGDLPIEIVYHGGDGGFDTLDIRGASSGSYLPGKVFGDGVFQSRTSRVTFTGLEPVYVDGTGIVDGTFTFTTPSSESGNDSISIHSPSAGKNRVSGTSGGVPFESITFSNYAHFVVDTSANDKPDFDTDSIVFASPLVAAGLETFIVRTGSGDDTVDLQGLDWSNSVNLNLSLGAGSNRLIKPSLGGDWDFATFDSGTLKGESGPGSVSFSGVSKALVRTLSGGLVQDASVNRQPTVLVFVEDALPDYQKLIDSLFGVGRVAGQLDYQTELVVLDGSGDGVQQITETLAEAADRSISAIHILSHGSVGVLGLGSVDLSRSGLDAYGAQFSDWRRALAEDADILLYGCRIGAGDPGGQFVERFSELTGADVAASIDDTGGSSRGGNWNLEFEFGDLEATRLTPDLSVAEYAGLLVPTKVVGSKPVTAKVGGDVLEGDAANNTFISNTGNDTLEGKAGDDTYKFNDGFGTDIVVDTGGTKDTLDFTGVKSGDIEFKVATNG